MRGSYDAAPPVAPEPRYYEGEADYAGYDAAPTHDHGYAHQDYAASAPQYAEPGYDDQQYDAGYHGGAEGGWSDDSHYLDYGVEEGIFSKSGSWYAYGDKRIGQGRDAAIEFLKENPKDAAKAEDVLYGKLKIPRPKPARDEDNKAEPAAKKS